MFLAVLAGIYALHRGQERLGGGREVARDPVCGMQIDRHHPGAVLRSDGQTSYFCSEHCRDRWTGTSRERVRSGVAHASSAPVRPRS